MNYFIFLFLFFHTSLFAQTVYAFIGADARGELKKTCKKDYKRMKKAVKSIAENADCKLKLTTLLGKELTGKKLYSWIHNIDSDSKDIIFFYFSGHGMASSKSKKWPALYFTTENTHISYSSLIEQVMKKKSHLTIMIAEACNGTSHLLPRASDLIPRSFLYDQEILEREGTKKLLEHKGSIICTSSSRGEKAWSKPSGAFFTRAFLFAIQQELFEEKPSWKRICRNTKNQLKGIQTPFFLLNL